MLDYFTARKRLDNLVGSMRSPVQEALDRKGDTDENGYGLVVVTDKHPETGEDIVYVTTNPQLIHEYCDRLEVQRDSN